MEGAFVIGSWLLEDKTRKQGGETFRPLTAKPDLGREISPPYFHVRFTNSSSSGRPPW